MKVTRKDGPIRRYQTPDGEFPSVTSILGALAKHALIPWAVNLEREFCVRVAKGVLSGFKERGITPNTMTFEYALRKGLGAKKAHQLFVQGAADIGTGAHLGVEATMRMVSGIPKPFVLGSETMVPIGPEAALAWREWIDWSDKVGLKSQLIEQAVWSKKHGYAGTLDCVAELELPTGQRGIALIDWKTGKAIWKESFLQNAAYMAAAKELGLVQGDVWGAIARMPKREGDPGFEVAWIPPQAQAFLLQSFLGVKAAWDFQHTKDPLAVVRGFPGVAPVATFDDARHLELEEEECPSSTPS